jgi:hypothetical protein
MQGTALPYVLCDYHKEYNKGTEWLWSRPRHRRGQENQQKTVKIDIGQ